MTQWVTPRPNEAGAGYTETLELPSTWLFVSRQHEVEVVHEGEQ